MTDEVLRLYVQRYIEAQPTPEVEFTWQGGEPTLLGLDFFQRAVLYQRQFAGNKVIRNTLQTNGTLLNDDWCAFLARERFMVGISLDGPRFVHDLYRPDKRGRSSFDDVMHGLELLKQHGVDFNVLVTVARDVARFPLKSIDSSSLRAFVIFSSTPWWNASPVPHRSVWVCISLSRRNCACTWCRSPRW